MSEATTDLDFLSSKGLVEKVNNLRVSLVYIHKKKKSSQSSYFMGH
jgi:hypothetical protein